MDTLKRILKTGARRAGLELSKARAFGGDPVNDIRTILLNKPAKTIFDVGANEGQTAVHYAREFPGADIYSFEPFPAVFESLKRNTSRLRRVKPVNCALGARSGPATLYTTEFSPTSSLLQPTPESNTYLAGCMKVAGQLEIQTKTVDEFCAENSINRVDLLKLDAQGYELKILEGARETLANKRVPLIFSELNFVPLYEKQAYFHEVYTHLLGFGFRLVALYDSNYRAGTYLNWCDGLFVNPDAL